MNSVKSSINSISNLGTNIKKTLRNPLRSRSEALCYYSPIPANNNSRIREIIFDLNEERQCYDTYDTYEFLILLSDDYYKKKMGLFPPKKYYIKNNLYIFRL